MRTTLALLASIGLFAQTYAYAQSAVSKLPSRPLPGAKTKTETSPTLVLVNGKPIHKADLDRYMTTRRIPEQHREKAGGHFLEEMIDQSLIQGYLNAHGTRASQTEIDDQYNKFVTKIGADQVPDLLEQAGYTEETLRAEIALPIAWQRHVQLVVTNQMVRDYFGAHKAEFDGTIVHASHIFLSVPQDAPANLWTQAEKKLDAIRQQVVTEQTTFADAAAAHSEGPSRLKGGDIGKFPFSGKMPEAFCKVAFALKPGEVSKPFRSPFGVHICVVHARKPGETSLEDARDSIIPVMARNLWKKTVDAERAKAKIEWKAAQPERTAG